MARIDPDKTLGALLGHAVGEMLGRGPGDGAPGTQMAFRLADSLIARGGFDPDDVTSAYVSWYGTKPEGPRSRSPRCCAGSRRAPTRTWPRRSWPRPAAARQL